VQPLTAPSHGTAARVGPTLLGHAVGQAPMTSPSSDSACGRYVGAVAQNVVAAVTIRSSHVASVNAVLSITR
jgi:hypothetical protein